MEEQAFFTPQEHSRKAGHQVGIRPRHLRSHARICESGQCLTSELEDSRQHQAMIQYGM